MSALFAVALATSACDRDGAPAPSPESTATASAPVAATAKPTAKPEPSGPKVYEREVLSPVYEVDQIYKSMQGPFSTKELELATHDDLELLWIVGFEAIMVKPDGESQVSQEFMCHTNLDIDPTVHNELFEGEKAITGRLFTLSQGQYRIDMPEGFGIPILSNELLSLNTQVLNLNREEGEWKVRHKVIMRFVRDADLEEPMKALYTAGAFGMKLLEGKDGHFGMDHGAQGGEHTACLPGQNAGAGESAFTDGKGRRFTGHWVVEPGREVNHTRVTDTLALPYDTTIHYAAIHLHPFAESLALKDLTTGKLVYEAKTRQAEKGIGLAHVDFFSSEEGLPLFEGHEYEVISVYDNTSGEPQDSMAVMNLYLHDKAFEKPDLDAVREKLKAREEADEETPGPAKKPTMGEGHDHAHPGKTGPGKTM